MGRARAQRRDVEQLARNAVERAGIVELGIVGYRDDRRVSPVRRQRVIGPVGDAPRPESGSSVANAGAGPPRSRDIPPMPPSAPAPARYGPRRRSPAARGGLTLRNAFAAALDHDRSCPSRAAASAPQRAPWRYPWPSPAVALQVSGSGSPRRAARSSLTYVRVSSFNDGPSRQRPGWGRRRLGRHPRPARWRRRIRAAWAGRSPCRPAPR